MTKLLNKWEGETDVVKQMCETSVILFSLFYNPR